MSVQKLRQLHSFKREALADGKKLKRGTPGRKLAAADVKRYRKEVGDLRKKISGSRYSYTGLHPSLGSRYGGK